MGSDKLFTIMINLKKFCIGRKQVNYMLMLPDKIIILNKDSIITEQDQAICTN